MSEWKEYRLGDISTMKYGKLYPKNTCGTIPIHSGYRVVGYTDQSNCPANTIIVVARGVGGCGDVKLLKEPVFLTNLSISVSIDSQVCLPLYFYYYHLLNNLRWLDSGSAQSQITIEDLKKYTFSIPSIATQHKIVSILSSLDDKIAVNKKICANLEAQAQALFKHWFVDFAPFKDGKFVESELGLIPEGWRVGTLSDLGEIVGGATPSKAESSYYTDKGIPWLTPKDLSNDLKKFTSRGEIDITENGYKSCSAKIMPRGSVLFSSRAPIGYLTIAKNDICTNQGFKSVVPKYAGTAYIYNLLKTNTKRIESMSSGTTFKEASGSLMKSLAVIIPPKNIIDNYEVSVIEMFNEQEVIEEESSRLATLRDTLLPKLMSGQIKV